MGNNYWEKIIWFTHDTFHNIFCFRVFNTIMTSLIDQWKYSPFLWWFVFFFQYKDWNCCCLFVFVVVFFGGGYYDIPSNWHMQHLTSFPEFFILFKYRKQLRDISFQMKTDWNLRLYLQIRIRGNTLSVAMSTWWCDHDMGWNCHWYFDIVICYVSQHKRTITFSNLI